MRNKFFKRTLTAAAVAAAMGLSVGAYAQSTTGSITGTVVNQANNVMPGATITVRNVETGYTRTVQAEEDGSYRFNALPVGRYTVTGVREGFEAFTSEPFQVSIGSASRVRIPLGTNMETIDVSGSAISMIDTTTAESALNITTTEIDRLPVPRNLSDVALLAPSTTKGDPQLGGGDLVSFSGASVAENAFYINGLNVTDFRNGLGGSTVPFEFYKAFEVKSGGYSAEFGRSTGGVVNAVTKSGTNEFHWGANAYYSPDTFKEDSPNVYYRDGGIYLVNEKDKYSKLDANIYASGPIIEDKLFYYVLYNPRDISSEYAYSRGNRFNEQSQDNAFWGAKVDWNITSDHIVELTAFSDQRDTDTDTYLYDLEASQRGDMLGTTVSSSGGTNWIASYTGYLTDDFTLSVAYGENKYERSSQPSTADCPIIQDNRDGTIENLGCWTSSTIASGEDVRKQFRVDAEYYLGDHYLRFGYDSEKNTATENTRYSGGAYYYYSQFTPDNNTLPGGVPVDANRDVLEIDRYSAGGSFDVNSTAIYIEDKWTITNELTARIGLRNESFENLNANGEAFIEVDNQLAPRLGLTWDVDGLGEEKWFVNYGRYYLPIAANTNIRMAGNEFFTQQWYYLDGINSDGTPVYDQNALITENILSDGEVPDVSEILDQEIDPMYQDEYILGYERVVGDNWTVGVKGIYRDLKSVIDDITPALAVEANGYDDSGALSYILTNPGQDVTVKYDQDGDGTLEQTTFTAADLGYPEPVRKYAAIEFTFERAWNDDWSLRGSYTWAHSWGNAEGYVKSDNGQDDAGLTTDWDFPYLMDGAYGNLPNDRRHTVKVFGSYSVADNFTVGANLLVQSGRPLNGFSNHYPPAPGQYEYGDTYYVGDTFTPRGFFGRTPWIVDLSLNAQYTMKVGEGDLTLRADVYNVFNAQNPVAYNEQSETNGSVNKAYHLPYSYQTPRSVMLSASLRF